MSSPAAVSTARRSAHATLPNLLSLTRVALVPVLVVLLAWPGSVTRAVAAVAFLVASITDFFDGWLARRHGITSVLGQFLDPLADKLMVAAVLIMLVAVGPEPRAPAWMAAVMVVREISVTGLRGIASDGGIVLPALELGKYKMLFQAFALEALLLHDRFTIPTTSLAVDCHAAGMVFLWVALVLAVWSGIDYHVRILRRLNLDWPRG